MPWYLNNNNYGASHAAQQFARSHPELGSVFFVYDGDLERIKAQIKDENSQYADDADAPHHVLLGVERVEGRVPNKDIVSIGYHPPFESPEDEQVVTAGLVAAMNVANSSRP